MSSCGQKAVDGLQKITLYNGVGMPMIGYGTFQITDAKQCRSCVADALAAGYRLVDTAAAYGNEEAVGAAVRQSGIARSELFITSKLWVQDTEYDGTLKAFDRSLKKLGLSYLDLYLIHQPFGDYYGAWRAMERLYEEGAVRAIGVSNFSPDRLVDLCLNQCIRPMVNQIELHPFYQQPEALQVMESYGVVPQAWGPLSGHYQRGIPTIPKTVHPERMRENLVIFDFALTEKEMEAIAAMDIGHSEIIDHRSFCTARQLNSIKIHE